MSKKRYGDYRLEQMGRDELLAYAKRITRDHGRAQESINRLRTRVVHLEEVLDENVPPAAPVQEEPHRTSAPHRTTGRTVHLSHAPRHRRMVLVDSSEAGHE